jgi:hypothetical protein
MSKQMIAQKLEMIVRRENLPIFRLITVTALTTTLVAHLTTFAGIDVRETIPLLEFTLSVGVFALCAAFYRLGRMVWPEETPAETVLDLIPRWAKCLAGATFAYSFFDFAIHWYTYEGTQAAIDGVYYLVGSDKRTVRAISYEEYRILSIKTFRMHTGTLLPFYAWLANGYVFCLR